MAGIEPQIVSRLMYWSCVCVLLMHGITVDGAGLAWVFADVC